MNNGDRRMIEDYLPLDTLNALSARDKKHPKHPVALVHYWPARRPTPACRAAVYSTLVPAAASPEARAKESAFVESLVRDFTPRPEVLEEAQRRVFQAAGARAPRILDQFAGRGPIPLEAARLGCDAYAVDYNPVAHLIELCTLVYPQRYGAALAAKLESWGRKALERVEERTAELYPDVTIAHDGSVEDQLEFFAGPSATVGKRTRPVAFIWARTVPCRRPGCNARVPLVRQAWLRKQGGAIASVPDYDREAGELRWKIVSGPSPKDIGEHSSQTGAGEAMCLACTASQPAEYVQECGRAGFLEEVPVAVVVDGPRSKLYLPPESSSFPDMAELKTRAANVADDLGVGLPEEAFQGQFQNIPHYGFETYASTFNGRQLLVIIELVRAIHEIRREMAAQETDSELAKATATFLSLMVGRFVNFFTTFCRWQNRDQITIGAIGDQNAMKMIYDFAEINPFATTAGALPLQLENEVRCIRKLSPVVKTCTVQRASADKLPFEDQYFDAVVTDPPYYGSVFYSDASAIFYVWHKRIIGDLYPEHFALPLPPKRKEAVAQPEMHGGSGERAQKFYEELMSRAFLEARRVLKPGAPLVCVYAHKTTEGWTTLINSFVNAGLTVTEAWPLQTEARGRVRSLGSAALSDSIFFVTRRRNGSGTGLYEADVEPELRRIAQERVVTLWAEGRGIGGADLLMAAVGAGLRAYTRFARVEYSNGEPMSAESYLREVEGVVLDVMLSEIFGLSGAGVGSIDPLTRFYVLWRFTYRESSIEAGDAYVFCYPQGIEVEGPLGISGPAPALVEKTGSRFRVRTYEERGGDEELGTGVDGEPAPLIDVLHRLLWLLDNRPRELPRFLKSSRPNLEQLRLATQALCAPVLGRPEAKNATPTAELRALSKLTANWRGIVEGAALAQEIERKVTRQLELNAGSTE